MHNLEEFIKKLKPLYEGCDNKSKDFILKSLQNSVNDLTSKTQENDIISKLQNKQFLLQQKTDIIDRYVFMTTSDTDGKILDISQAYLDFTGFKREDVIGENHKIFRNHSLDKKVIKNLWDTINQDKVWEGELKNSKFSGEEYWIYTVIKPLYNNNKIKIGYTSIKYDITTKKRLEELSTIDNLTLLNNHKQFDYCIKKHVDKAHSKKDKIALVLISIDYYQEYLSKHGETQANRLVLKTVKAMKEQLKSTIYEVFKISELEFAIVIEDKDDKYIKNIADNILTSINKLKIPNSESKILKHATLSIGIVNIDTSKHTISSQDLYNMADINLSNARKNGGNCIIDYVNVENINNLKNIDNITQLSNRNLFMHDLSVLNSDAMLIILHINQIKALKDLYGFNYITELIVDKAKELSRVINKDEASLYSLNLQEFAILVTDKNLFSKYISLLEHSILSTDFDNEKHTNVADFTAGVAYGIDNLFNHADLVLQEALLSKLIYKKYNSNLSAKQLQEDNLNRLKVYKNALHEGQIIPYFQPIVDSITNEVTKYEALARIETDEGEIISPYYFLDSAKEDKTFEFFTRQMMQKVFNIYDKNEIDISFNLAFENINSETMVNYIKNRLDKYGGDGITFEILESEDILDYNVIEKFITMVKSYGCKVSIDDFGSGYSNFTNIIKLDIDYIKLDGSLIEKLNTDENVRHMINGLLVYAKNANIKTIAEFVSSRELSDTVRALGINYMQGYYYSEPKSPEELGLVCSK